MRTRGEVLALAALAIGCVLGVVVLAGGWPALALHGADNDAYAAVAAALRTRDFRTVEPTAFWGLSYLVAAVATITRLDEPHALWMCSWSSALGVAWLAHGLWGPRVAAWVAIANIAWLQRAALGGAEPSFMLFLVAALTAVRADRWSLAALAAALATTVRPIGLFALVAIGVTLLARRAWRSLALAVAVGAAVGIAYVLPLWWIYGDPLINVHWYRRTDWQGHALPLSLPFAPLVHAFVSEPQPLSNTIKVGAWIVIVVAGMAMLLARGGARRMARERPVELGFALLATAFVLSYDARHWAWIEFPRFCIPLVPFALIGLERWLPSRRVVLWPTAALSGVVAGASAVNVRHAIELVGNLVRELLRAALGSR